MLERATVRRLAIALACAVAVVAGVLALPVHTWRTGETPLPPLSYLPGGAAAIEPGRLWIDTDPACGTGRWRDPDDCLALLALMRAGARAVAGLSSTFGNAPLEVTDRVARELTDAVAPASRVHRGCGAALPNCLDEGGSADAQAALADALRAERLVYVALGPLTNLARLLQRDPALVDRVARVVAVMGRRPGHRFHPGEARSHGAMLFGHGPVFSDLNAVLDPQAVRIVLASGIPIELVPYSAARQVLMSQQDLDAVAALGREGHWVAQRSRAWLQQWRDDIGIDGFYPFDLLAAARLLQPQAFRCAQVRARVAHDPMLRLLGGGPQLLVAQDVQGETPGPAATAARYCDRVDLRACSLFGTCGRRGS